MVLGASTQLLNVLATATSRTDVVAEMAKGFGRGPGRNWKVTEWLMGTDTDLRLVEMRAKRFVRVDADVAFEEGVSTIRDETECPVAREPAKQDLAGRWGHEKRCRKNEDICAQHTFFGRQLDRAKAAAKALEGSARDPDKKMGKQASALLARMPTKDSKGKACWGAGGLGGDIAIALECGADETLVTTDASFELICPAIGIACQRLQ
jgi:hypothetical protein